MKITLKKTFWYIFLFFLLADGCIICNECNEGRMKVKAVQNDTFVVQSITYDEQLKATKVTVLETTVLVEGKSPTTYSFTIPLTPKQLSTLKIKKRKKIEIQNTIMYNNAGKHYRVLKKICLTNMQGEPLVYVLKK